MKRRRAFALFGCIVIMLLGYVVWTCWPRTSIEWHHRIDAATKKSLEGYFAIHPLRTTPLTVEGVQQRLLDPYDLQVDITGVVLMEYSDGSEFIYLVHPDGSTDALSQSDGGVWGEVDLGKVIAEGAVPHIGRMFEERTKS